MNRDDIAKELADRYNITIETARQLCYSIFDILNDMLMCGEDVYIYKLGTFKHKKQKSKVAKHPKTGERIIIPERTVIGFKKVSK